MAAHSILRVLAMGAVVTATLGWPAAAVADLTFSGSFRGVTTQPTPLPTNPNTPWPIEFFTDAPVTGRFSVDIPEAVLAQGTVGPFNLLQSGRTHIEFDVRGEPFAFDAGPGTLFHGIFAASADGTNATFWSDYRPRFHGAIFSFHSEPGTLLAGERLTDLRIGPQTVTHMEAYFADPFAAYAVHMRVEDFSFDPMASPVPAPAPGWLLAVGLAVLATAHQRRSLRTASRKVASCTPTVTSMSCP